MGQPAAKRAALDGDLAYDSQRWQDAVIHFERAIRLCETSPGITSDLRYITVVRSLAEALRFTNSLDAAFRRAGQATSLVEALDHNQSGVEQEHGSCLIAFGNDLYLAGRYSQAIDAARNAFEHFKAVNYTRGLILALLDLGGFYPLAGGLQDGLDVLMRAQSLVDALPATLTQLTAHRINIAVCRAATLQLMERQEDAPTSILEALKLVEARCGKQSVEVARTLKMRGDEHESRR